MVLSDAQCWSQALQYFSTSGCKYINAQMIMMPLILFSNGLKQLLRYCFNFLENTWVHTWQTSSCRKHEFLCPHHIVQSDMFYSTQCSLLVGKNWAGTEWAPISSWQNTAYALIPEAVELSQLPMSISLPLISQEQPCCVFCMAYRKLAIVFNPTGDEMHFWVLWSVAVVLQPLAKT